MDRVLDSVLSERRMRVSVLIVLATLTISVITHRIHLTVFFEGNYMIGYDMKQIYPQYQV